MQRHKEQGQENSGQITRSDPEDESPEPEGPVGQSSWYGTVKVGVEWTLALLLLIATAPLVLMLAVVVKLTSTGPAFYSQTRQGLKGRPYRIIKLRTMRHDAEAQTGPVWAVEGDPRINAVGRFLRDTHLDELPQLWNVLRGEMSLIGPRPERPEIASRLVRNIPAYPGRLVLRPGVTGLAQMLLPADSDLDSVKRKLSLDLYYVRNVNFLLDVRIALCTAFYFCGCACRGICAALVKPYGNHARRVPARTADSANCQIGEMGVA
jgi:lipopolysaccharide/colanic/teichoic acid biosynthesis glycosyltransferase